MVDVEETNYIQVKFLPQNHVLKVEAEKLLLRGVEPKSRQFKLIC